MENNLKGFQFMSVFECALHAHMTILPVNHLRNGNLCQEYV